MFAKLFDRVGDAFSDLTGYAATRVPLARARGPHEFTLDLPGYCQIDTYSCGVVAGVMALKHFKPDASFSAFYARCDPHPEWGTSTARLTRGLRRSGVRVREHTDLTFAGLRAALDAGSPVLVTVQNPGSEDAHWVVVYGYGLKPNRVFLATNGFPLVSANEFTLRQFARLWSPHGNGLVCAAPKRPARSARKAQRVAVQK